MIAYVPSIENLITEMM